MAENVFLYEDRAIIKGAKQIPRNPSDILYSYLPPEYFESKKWETPKFYVWNLGVIAYEMMNGQLPMFYSNWSLHQHMPDVDKGIKAVY